MDRTLDDIEGRYLIVPPGEGVSLAGIDKLAYPTMAYTTGQERPAALFVVRPLRRDDPESLDGSGRYDGGISFDDLLRTVHPGANPDVWTNADSASYWRMGVSSPSKVDGFSTARVFAPTLPGAPRAERPEALVSFEDMIRPIDPAAVPDTWVDSHEPERTGEWSPAGAGDSQPWAFNTPFGAFDPRSAADMSSPRASTADPAPVEPSLTERIAALGQVLPGYFRGGETTPSAERMAGIGRMAKPPPFASEQWFAERSGRLFPWMANDLAPWTGYNANSTAQMRASTEAPSDIYNRNVTKTLLSAGVPTRVAEQLGPKLGGALQMVSPVGIVTSAEDAVYHAGRGEYLPMTMAAFGLVPGGRLAGKTVRPIGKTFSAPSIGHNGGPPLDITSPSNSLARGGARLSPHHAGQAAAAEHNAQAIRAIRQDIDPPNASLYPFETVPQRPYEWDYPNPVKAAESRRLLQTIDGDDVIAKHVAGRRKVGDPDVRISEAALYQAARELTGNPIRFVHPTELPDRAVAAYYRHVPEIRVWNRLTPSARYEAIAHELGHRAVELNPKILDDMARSAQAQAELGRLYHWGYKGNYTPPLKIPQDFRYSDADALEELVAELYRVATTKPNSAKSLAPIASELLRKSHNKNPLLNRTLQINSLPAAVGLGALAYPSQEPDER